jgi:Ca2+-binding RTX toxin-like protein
MKFDRFSLPTRQSFSRHPRRRSSQSNRRRLDWFEKLESRWLLAAVTLTPLQDNTLFEDAQGDVSNGAGSFLFAGRTAQGSNNLRRTLLEFDIAGSIPAGSTINTVTLTLHMSRTITGASDVAVHRVLADWGEGTSDAAAAEGRGTVATTGDATWLNTFFSSEFWTNPGGDFAGTPSGTTSVGSVGDYSWSGAGLVSDVAAWIASPATNSGWILIGNEQPGSAKRFDSRENLTVANRPRLLIDFDPPVSADFGDAPDAAAGTGSGNYRTVAGDNGPSHTIVDGLFLGDSVDPDDGTLQNASADADDLGGLVPDDENGVLNADDLQGTEGTAPDITLKATNTTGSAATLFGWIDINRDGVFDNATERALTTVPNGTMDGSFTLIFPTLPDASAGTTFARFRLSTDAAAANSTGASSDGEVEDYSFSIASAVNLPNGGGSYEVLRDGDDLVLRVQGGAELFRKPTSQVLVLNVDGSGAADVVTVLNTGTVVDTPILFDGKSGNDSFNGVSAQGPITLQGGQGADTLIGGVANDSITGGDGDDRVFAGSGNDHVDGGSGDNQLFGDSGNDTLIGSTGRDQIRGGDGNDDLDGGSGFDTLAGDRGNDTLVGGDGNDTVFGGPGLDSISGDGGDDRLFGENGYDTISGGGGNDFIRGGRGKDQLSGDAGSDEIFGDEQNDTLSGGDGADTLNAGDGDDVVFAGAGFDVVNGGAGNDRLFGNENNDMISGGIGSDFIRGGGGSDRLSGDGGFDEILGDEDSDTLSGGDGNDTLTAGAGSDRVFAGLGNDQVDGGANDDQLFGGAGNDTISGSTGRDLVRGGADNDLLNGDGGFDTLFGDQGNDTITGGDGNDTVFAGNGRDSVSGGAGNDRLFGNNGYDTIVGGLGNDFLRGGRGRDSLTGDAGNDELIGDEHNDTLTGGSGSDRVTGGAGADTIDVQEAPLSDGIDSVIGSDMTDTVFTDPADLLI